MTYRDAGVDIAAGDALVEAVKPLAASTRRAGSDAGLGGFGALFDLKAAGFSDPILVASTDGVGTKLKVAIEAGKHDTVGIDLVAMCVNDLVVQGAEPLFFLDYYATAALDVAAAASVIAGIAEGCRQSGCALIGGETAEMPGLYAKGDYDLAGFAVGAAERGALLPREDVAEGDVVLGVASAGLHSNGFSLIRRVVEETGADYSDPAPFDSGRTLGEALLAPTRLYVRQCLKAARGGHVKAFAHITGGGLTENLPRVLPDEVGAEIDASAWPQPGVFAWAMREGNVAADEMCRTFNCGIGMMAVVGPERVEEARAALSSEGDRVYEIGRIVRRGTGVAATTVRGHAGVWGVAGNWRAVSDDR